MTGAVRQMKIGLTGGIACGKSLLSRFLNELGVETLDADDIVHELIPDGERRRLAATVFKDPVARRALEARIHPIVKTRLLDFLAFADERQGDSPRQNSDGDSPRQNGDGDSPLRIANSDGDSPLRIAIIPLLFEVHWDEIFDIICCVASEREIQIARMVERRGYTRAEAEARLGAQMPVSEKAAKSHYVIRNDGSAEELRDEAVRFVAWLKERRRKWQT